MKTDKQQQRRLEIEKAAFELLAEKGYRRTSMLQIAKRASASNQTLYAWYGSKENLFASIIKDNAKHIQQLLHTANISNQNQLSTLQQFGRLLLGFASGDKAIIINRAAIADATDTGVLANAINRFARSEMLALVSTLITQLIDKNEFTNQATATEISEIYISLLFSEIPMQQALGQIPALTPKQINQQADRAFDLICKLYAIEEK